MRKIIVEVETSVDGCMGSEDMAFWQQAFPFHGQDVQDYLSDLLFMPEALIMGRKTYQSFAEVWPARDGKDADRINGMLKYVASRTLAEPLIWNATLLKGNVVEDIKKLKQKTGRPLLQYGVGELTQTLLDNQLVDELRILTHPFIYGEGPHVFEHMGVHRLNLMEIIRFNSGAIAHHYHPVEM